MANSEPRIQVFHALLAVDVILDARPSPKGKDYCRIIQVPYENRTVGIFSLHTLTYKPWKEKGGRYVTLSGVTGRVRRVPMCMSTDVSGDFILDMWALSRSEKKWWMHPTTNWRGVTLGYDNVTQNIAISICHPRDNFSRPYGRRAVMATLEHNQERKSLILLPFSQSLNFIVPRNKLEAAIKAFVDSKLRSAGRSTEGEISPPEVHPVEV